MSSASAPFDFSVSYAALTKTTNVPQQCLQLPPSMTVGAVLQEEGSGLTYAQPRITYSLVANVEIWSHSGNRLTMSASKEIPIWSTSAPSPPINTADFPAEYVERLYHACRPNRFRKETLLMTVSSAEPSPIVLINRSTVGDATCVVSVTLADTRLGSDVEHLLTICSRIRLSIIPALRIKTFYSITPFSRMPGQTMLTAEGPIRLHDELRTLSSATYSNLVWQTRRADGLGHSQEAVSAGTAVCSTVAVLLQTPQGISPSFCSAVVSRQYSLIMRCKVKGVSVQSFDLEVPLQISYGLSESRQMLDNPTSQSADVAASTEIPMYLQSTDHSDDNGISNPISQQQHRLSPPDYAP